MQLFSDTHFFAIAVILPLLLILHKAVRGRYSPYALFIFGVTALIFLGMYRNSLLAPLLLFCTSFLILQLVQKAHLKRSIGLILTLLPLVLLKTKVMTFFSMIGVSFITFRAIDTLLFADEAQSVDVIEYFTYMFFPMALLAGPMYRWRNFKLDLAAAYQRLSIEQLLEGWETLVLGIFQKFGVAELINGEILDKVAPNDYSHHGMLINALGYTAYLYFDFAGYSNMALGVAAMLGFHLPVNFNNPIASRNPQDFWKRWHMSLSEWLRDVVFMPIYKSLQKVTFFTKHKLFAQNIGIFATLFFMGTWNGLQKDYVISGVLFGTYSVGYNTMVNIGKSNESLRAIMDMRIPKLAGRIITITLAVIALYIFSGRSPI